jgi:ribosomal protein S18 acetylase RimI-like enzyme
MRTPPQIKNVQNRRSGEVAIRIRKAGADDFEEVFRLFWEFIKSHRQYDQRYYTLFPQAEFRRMYRKIFNRFLKGRTRFFLVAETDGKIIGTVRAEIVKRHPSLRTSQKHGEVTQLMVRPDFRRRGVARALMDEALERLRGMGMKRAVLRVDAKNIPAKKLYADLGFEDRQIIMTKYF